MTANITILPALPADAAAIARVKVATWRTTYPGLIAQDTIDRLTVAEETEVIGRALRGETGYATQAFVALHEGVVVGFVTGGPVREPLEEYDGELYALYLMVASQRTGLGARLTRRLARRLIELGYRTMLVRVLAANPACAFYERLGGVLVEEGEHPVDGRMYQERAYAFPDLAQLAAGGELEEG